jgi:hypothetical protein
MVHMQKEFRWSIVSKSGSIFNKGFFFFGGELLFYDLSSKLSSFISQIISIADCSTFGSFYVFLDDMFIMKPCHCSINVDTEWPVFIFFKSEDRTMVHFGIKEKQ